MISYSGDGTDPDDGSLPASAFTWNIDFLHDGHVHPGTPITGARSGSFTIPTSGHDFSGNTRYRITLTVRDSDGLTSTRSVTVYPQKVNLSFDTVPSGRTLYLDGIAKTTPFVYDTLVGFNHTIEAQRPDRGQHRPTRSRPGPTAARAAAHDHGAGVARRPTRRPSTRPRWPTGLVGAWSFNEGSGATVARLLGQRQPRHPGRRRRTWDPGRQDTAAALSFSGLGGNVTVPHASSLNLSSSYTLEAWVKPTALNSYQTILIKEADLGLRVLAADRGQQDQQRLQQRRLSRAPQRHHPGGSAEPVVAPRRGLQRRREHLHALPQRDGRSRPRPRPPRRFPTPRRWSSARRAAAAAASSAGAG